MFSRAISAVTRQSFTKLGRITRPQQRRMSAPALKEPHMNDCMIPHESHESGYKRRQKMNTLVLVTGVIFFAISSTYVFTSGKIVPNLTPPKKNLSD